MPSPLKWNDQRQWTFAINLRQPVFYLLRDHINMFTDLSKDWASGPPSSYDRFIPMLYKVEIDMSNYELNTYVNDHNIIDKPLIREENGLYPLLSSSCLYSLHDSLAHLVREEAPESGHCAYDEVSTGCDYGFILDRSPRRSATSHATTMEHTELILRAT